MQKMWKLGTVVALLMMLFVPAAHAVVITGASGGGGLGGGSTPSGDDPPVSFNFSTIVLGNPLSGSILLNTVYLGGGVFGATGATGTINGVPIALLGTYATAAGCTGYGYPQPCTVSPGNLFLYDNKVAPSVTPLVSLFGLAFTAPTAPSGSPTFGGNPIQINVFYDGSYEYYEGQVGQNYVIGSGFTPTAAVPEPAIVTLLGAGLLGLGVLRRRSSVG